MGGGNGPIWEEIRPQEVTSKIAEPMRMALYKAMGYGSILGSVRQGDFLFWHGRARAIARGNYGLRSKFTLYILFVCRS